MASQMVRYVLAAALRFAQRLDDVRVQQHAGAVGAAAPRAAVGGRGRRAGPRRHRRRHRARAGGAGFRRARLRAFAQGDRRRALLRRRRGIPGVPRRARRARQRAARHAGDARHPEPRARSSQLADGAHLVNVGRGSALVEDDLARAPRRAASSRARRSTCSATEPLPPEHPFWRHPRITITPHVAGLTMPEDTVAQIAAQDRAPRARRLPVTGVVDRARGY